MRKNIGLLINDLNTPFTSEAVKGAELGARVIDANMYIFIIPLFLMTIYSTNISIIPCSSLQMIITWIFYIL